MKVLQKQARAHQMQLAKMTQRLNKQSIVLKYQKEKNQALQKRLDRQTKLTLAVRKGLVKNGQTNITQTPHILPTVLTGSRHESHRAPGACAP